MPRLGVGDWVRVLPTDWSMQFGWNGQIGRVTVIFADSDDDSGWARVVLQSGTWLYADVEGLLKLP